MQKVWKPHKSTKEKNNSQITCFPQLLAPSLNNFRVLYFDSCFVCSPFSYIFISHSLVLYIMIAYKMLSCFILVVRSERWPCISFLFMYLFNIHLLTPTLCVKHCMGMYDSVGKAHILMKLTVYGQSAWSWVSTYKIRTHA